MMQPFAASPNPTPRLQQVLDLIDRVAIAQGRDVPQIVEIERLRFLPTGTFGRTWANFLNEHNLQPFTTGSRRKQLHDGIHVLTGYGADLISEVEVQAFLLGTKFSTSNLMLGLGLLRVIHKNLNSQQQFSWDRLWQAYQRGCNSHLDPDTWQPELLWHLPLTDVQSLFSTVKN
ncbi:MULTISPECIES: Coq4 family protein [unclassified Nostoc]|uniref:Coq4 family protein n=2 Tax=Nostoc TaxID=1177 RepID=UPI000D0BF35B|nr:Coq4 family protein [Nostoc sp. 'Peltigera membranacea cyanobiont' N6]AVH64615.1 coenzyme Q (ubiquinone) biosynthesis protein Coq4 [Nostoc sp. 'Peltigera membranacea cyanobiont' N6]